MRKLWLIVVCILWITILSGEKILTIYQKDKILYSTKTTAIDSLKFSNRETILDIHKAGYPLESVPVASIDSITFTDSISNSLPVVETVYASFNNATNKGSCYVTVTSDGGYGSLLERGICWSATPNPTTKNSKYASGTTIGEFYGYLTNLSYDSIYYVRAYATNPLGTAYGRQLTVKPIMGNVTYTLGFDSITYPEPYRLMKIAMDSACFYFNRYTRFSHNVSVVYSPGVPTAQASYHGQMAFGSNTSYMWVGTAIHELAHYFGSGTTTIWKSKMVNGVWSGSTASAFLLSSTGGTLKGDTQHYWPYGINYKTEITGLGNATAQTNGLILSVKIIQAMLIDDCGLPSRW